jgi:hypothetical protein
MPAKMKTRGFLPVTLFFLGAMLAGCGGGGGSAQSGTLVDPSSSYTGVLSQATVSSANAQDLALGGFFGGMVGSSVLGELNNSAITGAATAKAAAPSAKSVAAGQTTARQTAARLPLRQFAQALKLSIRRMQIPQKAAALRKSTGKSGTAKAVARSKSFQISGDSGGSASYSLDVNDSNGTFFGTVTYRGFTSQGTVTDGTVDLLGSFDANRQDIAQMTISTRSLTLGSGNSQLSLTGTMSWVFNLGTSTESLSMNLVLLDKAPAKTYWFRNYQVVTVYGSNSLSQSISGQYYDHDQGFIYLATQIPLVASYGSQWPTLGVLTFNGSSHHWARLTFLTNTMSVDADTDGDGASDWRTEVDLNSSPFINSPPVADAGPDQSVSQATTVQLDGSASSDPDGDPLSYAWSFDSYPSNSAPSLTGANTATPSFKADVAGTYQLSLQVYDGVSMNQDSVTVVVKPAAPLHPDSVRQQWNYGIFGSNIGQAGLLTADLDGDGIPEIIAGASTGGFGDNSFWYVLRKDGNGGYQQIWRSEDYGVTVIGIKLVDLNDDGKADVVVALADGTIHIYDGPTLQEFRRLTVASPLKDLAIADLNNDGKKEIVTTDGIGVSVYSAVSGALQWSVATGGGSSLAVGNVDADPLPEIVTTSYGGNGYVLNGVGGAVKWTYSNSFGAKVLLADLNGDGKNEIIGASSWYKITIFDGSLKSPIWEIATNLDIDAVAIIDTDGDAIPEIVYGDGQWGKIHAIDVRTHAEKWSIGNPADGVSGIAFADVDLDGKKEILWGSGGGDTGADFLYVADPATGTVKWQNQDMQGLSALAVGDLNNDGTDKIVMVTATSNSGYDEGIIHVFDTLSHHLEFQQKLGVPDWMGNNRVVRIGDVNGDGRSEFVVSTANLYDGMIKVYDGATRALKGQTAGYSGNFFSAIAIGDVDNDGKVEIVAGQGREHTGAQGVYLIVFDGATLQEKWRSVDLGDYWGSVYDIKLADLDKDGHQEIILSLTDDRLIVFDGVTHAAKLMLNTPARALEVRMSTGTDTWKSWWAAATAQSTSTTA